MNAVQPWSGPHCHPKAGSLTAQRLATPAVPAHTVGAAACPTPASAHSQPPSDAAPPLEPIPVLATFYLHLYICVCAMPSTESICSPAHLHPGLQELQQRPCRLRRAGSERPGAACRGQGQWQVSLAPPLLIDWRPGCLQPVCGRRQVAAGSGTRVGVLGTGRLKPQAAGAGPRRTCRLPLLSARARLWELAGQQPMSRRELETASGAPMLCCACPAASTLGGRTGRRSIACLRQQVLASAIVCFEPPNNINTCRCVNCDTEQRRHVAAAVPASIICINSAAAVAGSVQGEEGQRVEGLWRKFAG